MVKLARDRKHDRFSPNGGEVSKGNGTPYFREIDRLVKYYDLARSMVQTLEIFDPEIRCAHGPCRCLSPDGHGLAVPGHAVFSGAKNGHVFAMSLGIGRGFGELEQRQGQPIG